uniref:Uncharacterized protein n=1 Tax=viral metagenome TaxID=1070528 RepID=A0A6M3JDM2_9ZZZZ
MGEKTQEVPITTKNIRDAIENPDLMTSGCHEHIFHIKGNMIVYSKLMFNRDKGYEVICADILKKPKPL